MRTPGKLSVDMHKREARAQTVNNKECQFGARRVSAGKTPGGKMEASGRELCKRGTQLALGTCTRTMIVFTYANEGLWTVSIGNDTRLK